jgi:hypothetical protein
MNAFFQYADIARLSEYMTAVMADQHSYDENESETLLI